MRLISRLALALCVAASAVAISPVVAAQSSPFVGSWNMVGTGADSSFVYWLEVKEENGQLSGRFLNRVGSPITLGVVKVENGELVFQAGRPDRLNGPEYRAKLEGGKLVGRHSQRTGGRGEGPAATERVVNWVGAKRPTFPPSDANAAHKYGTPVALFDGKTMDAFGVQRADQPWFWGVVDGILTDVPPANNLVSKEKFSDFKLEMEYRLGNGSNSGLYLRGRYELQLFDDRGQPPAITGHMAIYGRTAASVNASRAPYQWQEMTAILVGDRVTVTLNGQRVHDNAVIEGITGGALDNDELAPGPIMIQGDHSLVHIRKLVVTPIVK
jgi:hypothetical protein